LEAYHNRNDIVKEFISKQPVVSSYIGACNETRKKYCILQAQIEEEEHDFQTCIEFVRDSLLQQVEPNIKQIDDHCKAVMQYWSCKYHLQNIHLKVRSSRLDTWQSYQDIEMD
jgi:hypothetical protein